MDFNDLQTLYVQKKDRFGNDAYKHISEILRDAKEIHYQDWKKNPTRGGDHEQSWRAFKGKNLEKLVEFIIKDEVESLGLMVCNGNSLERSERLPKDLSQLKRNLSINYGEFGLHLPDVDIIIYLPETQKVIAVISSKVTLRERIAQTGYWKLKFLQDEVTEHIKVFFITPDEDETFRTKNPMKKGRAIVEKDLDGSYVLSENPIEESNKVKIFGKFMEDLKKVIQSAK